MNTITTGQHTVTNDIPASTSRLRGDAQEFMPTAMAFNHSYQTQALNPRAAIFRPTPGRNVLATPFVPQSPAVPERNPARLTETQNSTSSGIQTLDVHATVFVPSSGQNSNTETITAASSTETTCLSKPTKGKESIQIVKILPAMELPASVVRSRAESGQLVRRSTPTHLMPPPSSFPIEGGSTPSFLAASETFYDGGTEAQRQKFKMEMRSERELLCDWKANLLCANGEELPRDKDDMTGEQEDAERKAAPPSTHHFNWLGDPVHFKSKTPPAVSLVVIMSLLKPKGLMYGPYHRDLHKATLFKNAFRMVDPVYYYGNHLELLFTTRGTRLQELVTGDVARIYSEKGDWCTKGTSDPNEDLPEIDPLNDNCYRDEDMILNGWYENHDVTTRRDFVQLDARTNENIYLGKKITVLRKLSSTIDKSGLCNVLLLSDVATYPSESDRSSKIIDESLHYDQELTCWADEAELMPDLPPMNTDWIRQLKLFEMDVEGNESDATYGTRSRQVSTESSNLSNVFSSDPDLASLSQCTDSEAETIHAIEGDKTSNEYVQENAYIHSSEDDNEICIESDQEDREIPLEILSQPSNATELTFLSEEVDNKAVRRSSSVPEFLVCTDTDEVTTSINHPRRLVRSATMANLREPLQEVTQVPTPVNLPRFSANLETCDLNDSFDEDEDKEGINILHTAIETHSKQDSSFQGSLFSLPVRPKTSKNNELARSNNFGHGCWLPDSHTSENEVRVRKTSWSSVSIPSLPSISESSDSESEDLRPVAPTPSRRLRRVSSSFLNSSLRYGSIIEAIESPNCSDTLPEDIDESPLSLENSPLSRRRILIIEPPRSAYNRDIFDSIDGLNSVGAESDTEDSSTDDTASLRSDSLVPTPPLPEFRGIDPPKDRPSFAHRVSRRFSLTHYKSQDDKKPSLLARVKTSLKHMFDRQMNTLH